MRAQELLTLIREAGIETIAGVPDSTLKQFCDALQQEKSFQHHTTVNEGAAVAMAVGTYLATAKPACVYMQNSGIGNAVNPLTSLANKDVYGIPMLFIVGWRGEPGVKDEPQHVFQGKITCECFDLLAIPYEVIDSSTTVEELAVILNKAKDAFAQNLQFAIIVKSGTFEKDKAFTWDNGQPLNREEALGKLLEVLPHEVRIVSTTGKISRELYEQSNRLYDGHDNLFMSVGGMGHASMIALGMAAAREDKTIVCVEGDGAALMHMGNMALVASEKPKNMYHIIINNQAHESVGAMPTDCQQISFAEVAKALGYQEARRINSLEEIEEIGKDIQTKQGPLFYEIMVGLGSRADLCRPKEAARENKEVFMKQF